MLTGVPLNTGPVLLWGVPPECRYWSFQCFLPGAKTNSAAQCLRDTEATIDPSDGSYTVCISTKAQRPKWAGPGHWVEVPEGAKRCILCLRAYCPKMGVGFRCPDVWFGTGAGVASAVSAAGAVAAAGRCEALGDAERVLGMAPAMTGPGALHRRLAHAALANAALLLAAAAGDAMPPGLLRAAGGLAGPAAEWASRTVPLRTAALAVPLGAALGLGLYAGAFALVRSTYRNLSGAKGLVPNVSVATPDPKGDLKGHPKHLYYTIPYDARASDVEIKGYRTGKFTYTSVIAYGWHSLPPANGSFRYDETLRPDPPAAAGKAAGKATAGRRGKGKEEEEEGGGGGDRYTVILTTRPTFAAGVNEIDVSEEPTGLCLIRLIYPESQAEVDRCKPAVRAL